MTPTEPGTYRGRQIIAMLGGQKATGLVETVEVVASVPNPRSHRLLVKTNGENPKYRSLDCYEWEPHADGEQPRPPKLDTQEG